jgi:hypothetical protein
VSPGGCQARIVCRWPQCGCPPDQPATPAEGTDQVSPAADFDGAIAQAEADAADYRAAAERRREADDPVAAADLDWQAGRALELADRYRRTRDQVGER